jgi:hypothetical protein
MVRPFCLSRALTCRFAPGLGVWRMSLALSGLRRLIHFCGLRVVVGVVSDQFSDQREFMKAVWCPLLIGSGRPTLEP